MVTGASFGVGEAFARELSKKRSHLMLTARSRDKLEKVALELEMAHNIQRGRRSWKIGGRDQAAQVSAHKGGRELDGRKQDERSSGSGSRLLEGIFLNVFFNHDDKKQVLFRHLFSSLKVFDFQMLKNGRSVCGKKGDALVV